MKPLVNPSIAQRIIQLKSTLRDGTNLVAVSKFHPASAVIEAYDSGQRIFGESRVQELQEKYAMLSEHCPDIQWHFIGPLQTNKVKYIAPYISLMESITSTKLLAEVNRQALRCGRRIPILLEVHIAQEETKSGFSIEDILELLAHVRANPKEYEGIQFCGLMAMASLTSNEEQIREEFSRIQTLQQEIISQGLASKGEFTTLSMGMSGDYLIAQSCGATLVRIGSAIFGDREY